MPAHHLLHAPMMAITRSVTVAADKFAPGHLGELTACPARKYDSVL
ncbi:hypothetical protein [Streptomyces sp. NBC_01320]|nr:hypothetical protein OG395_04170 [Streptomyces sp. NBC_01320]